MSACGGSEVRPPASAVSAAAGAKVQRAPAFIEDDYPRALQEARTRGVPLFVDVWAPWCHSCVSMRAYVLSDARLGALASDFVFAAVDAENPANAAFVAAHPISAYPTLFVVDARTDTPLLAWEGTATAEELTQLLGDTRAGAGDAAATFAKANRAKAAGDLLGAKTLFLTALDDPKASRELRDRTIEGLTNVLSQRKELDACAHLVAREHEAMRPGTSRASALALGASCAEESHAASLPAILAAVTSLAKDGAAPILADDRSGLFEVAVDAEPRPEVRIGLAKEWAAFLEAEAKRAQTPAARAVFDPHRLLAYIAMGDPGRAIPMLEASERDLPRDYNPPARLARAYLELRRFDEAQAAVDRAIARVYGPRTMRVYNTKADILERKGDPKGAADALAAGIAFMKKSAFTAANDALIAAAEARLAKLRR